MGLYDLSAPSCASTSASPAYPAISYRVALFDFDALTTHTLVVHPLTLTETFDDGACRVVAEHTVFRNYDGILSARHDRHFTFAPAGCVLHATARGSSYAIGPDFSALMRDSDDLTEELPFEVSTGDGESFSLKSEDIGDLNQLWASYGCSSPDRLQIAARRHSAPL